MLAQAQAGLSLHEMRQRDAAANSATGMQQQECIRDAAANSATGVRQQECNRDAAATVQQGCDSKQCNRDAAARVQQGRSNSAIGMQRHQHQQSTACTPHEPCRH
eukprot:1158785-Pelagomonas_calceolata.AAC.4